MLKKVSIIGAGNVGGTAAMRIAESGLARVALIDVAPNLAKAKASDIEDSLYSLDAASRIEAGTELYLLDESDIVVVTAGLARKPGMTREDLVSKNTEIVSGICKGISEFAPSAIVIMVTNPLDLMTYLALKKTGFPRKRVFGMGVNLDSARFANKISKKVLVGTEQIEALVIGSHGETMLPLPRLSRVRGKALSDLLSAADIKEIVKETKQRGAEMVSLYGAGSAYIGPSAAIFQIVSAIVKGETKELPVSAFLDGEYNLHDVTIGVPARIGPDGIREIIELKLDEEERQDFVRSSDVIKEGIKTLNL